MMKHASYFSLLLLLALAWTGSSCGGADRQPDNSQSATTEENTSEEPLKTTSDSPYLNITVKGYSKDTESGRFVPEAGDSRVAYAVIQTQSCNNCTRLKSLDYFKEELMLVPEFRDAFIKDVKGKRVFFAGMLVEKKLKKDDPKDPILIAEFMANSSLIVAITIYPKDEEGNYKDYVETATAFMEALMEVK